MKQLHYFQLFPKLISNFVSDFFYCNSSFSKFIFTAHYCTLHSLIISHHHFILSCCQEVASGQRQSRFVLFFLLFIHFLSLKNKMATFPVCFQLKIRWSYFTRLPHTNEVVLCNVDKNTTQNLQFCVECKFVIIDLLSNVFGSLMCSCILDSH